MCEDHAPRFVVEQSQGPRGIQILMAFREDFTFPFGYLMYTTCGEYGSTRIRADIVDVYVPAGMRKQGVAKILIRHLQERVHCMHTPTVSGPAAEAMLRSTGFTWNERGMDWVWYNETIKDEEEPEQMPSGITN